jgi:hypothetical protein
LKNNFRPSLIHSWTRFDSGLFANFPMESDFFNSLLETLTPLLPIARRKTGNWENGDLSRESLEAGRCGGSVAPLRYREERSPAPRKASAEAPFPLPDGSGRRCSLASPASPSWPRNRSAFLSACEQPLLHHVILATRGERPAGVLLLFRQWLDRGDADRARRHRHGVILMLERAVFGLNRAGDSNEAATAAW